MFKNLFFFSFFISAMTFAEMPLERFNTGISLMSSSTGGRGLKVHFQSPIYYETWGLYFTAEDYVVNNAYYYAGKYEEASNSVFSLGFLLSHFHQESRLSFKAGGAAIMMDERIHHEDVIYGGELGLQYDHLLTAKIKWNNESCLSFFTESLYRLGNAKASKISDRDFFKGVTIALGLKLFW